MAAVKIEEEARRRKVKVTIKKGKVSDANILIKSSKADVVVATAVLAPRDDVPVFSGVPLLTNVGQKEFYDNLFGTIAKLSD
jgi:galactitol-specific phosphotransferase system IIB component